MRTPHQKPRNFGQFLLAVRQAAFGIRNPHLVDATASAIANENTGADGGFAVPPEYRTSIMQRVFAEDDLLARTNQVFTPSNSITLPVDATTPWQASGGIQSKWEGEGIAFDQSKLKLEAISTKLTKIVSFVPVTNELIEDSGAGLDAYMKTAVPEKMAFDVSYGITWGTGAGMPLGFMNAPCLVTTAAEAGQAADTIVHANVAKMWSRMPLANRRNSIWLTHPDAEPQLETISATGGPNYIPPGENNGSPFGYLKGRPVIPHEVCETLGDLGDIMLVDLTGYLTALKDIGVKQQTSLHVYFDQDLTAFKFTLRVAGLPWWASSVPSRAGSGVRSPFISLAAR